MTHNNGRGAYNIGAMQSDAQRRVYEMQRRAQMAVSGNQVSAPQMPKNEPYNRRPSEYKDAQTFVPTKTETEEKENLPPQPQEKKTEQSLSFPMLKQLEKDPERVLLLSLVLLLSAQNCDPLLLLALLYII